MTATSNSAVQEIAELANAGASTVYEAYGRRGLLAGPWHRITPGRRAAGPARIARCGPADNRAVHEVMADLQPGEVLVLTMVEPEDVALLGELLATQALVRGAAGILVEGAVRDTIELADMPLTILARWRSPRGATRRHRGEINVPIRIGETTIAPGDLVVLDDDGATAVPSRDFNEAIAAVRARLARETDLRERWISGELSYDAYGLRNEDENRSNEEETT